AELRIAGSPPSDCRRSPPGPGYPRIEQAQRANPRAVDGRTSMTPVLRLCAAVALAATALPVLAAEYLPPTSERLKTRAYSRAVVTGGGRPVWLAGQTGIRDDQGKDLSGNFEAQARQIFHARDQTLKKTGGSPADMVTMTVFINDPRHGD